MKRLSLLLTILLCVGAGCAQSVTPSPTAETKPVMESMAGLTEMNVNEGVLRGTYVVPENQENLPGIVIVHEWWGLNDQIKNEARHLAHEGYAVFAIDLYDGTVAADATEAGKLATDVRNNPGDAVAKMKAALDYLSARPEVAHDRLAALGWCFGGGQEAILATEDSRLKASVIYYGTPITDPAKLAKIQHPVLGIWGEDDQSIPVKDAHAFEDALKKQGTPVEFHYYQGAGHAFANPTRGDSYRPEATADAWKHTIDFLKTNLGR